MYTIPFRNSLKIIPIPHLIKNSENHSNGIDKMAAILKIYCASSEPKGQLTWNLVGSIGATCRLKIAKIIQIRNARWQLSWKSILLFFFWTKRPTDLKLGRKYQGNFGSPRWPPSWKSSPEPKGQLTPNFEWSIGATCRSKIAKVFLIGNPNGCQLENLFCASSCELKGRQLTGNLVGSIRATCR